MSTQPEVDNQDTPTQAPSIDKGSISIQAADSSQNKSRAFNDNYMDAKSSYAEAISGLTPSTSILDKKSKAPDVKAAIDNLKVQYADNLPKADDLSRKNQLNELALKTKTGQFADDIQSSLKDELNLEDELNDNDELDDKDEIDPNDPENEKEKNNEAQKGGPAGGGSIFSLLKKQGKKPHSVTDKEKKKNETPVTDKVIKNNSHARKHLHEISEATALCASTQGALKAHLSQQDYDTAQAMEQIRSGEPGAEAQKLLNDPVAQSLINQNDAATTNALMVMNPERMHETNAVLESGFIDPELKTEFKDQLNNATSALESNEELPTMDQKLMEKVTDSIKDFLNSVRSMFGMKSGQGQAAQNTM